MIGAFGFTGLAFSHAPEAGQAFAQRLTGGRPLFVCVIAATDTALVPGLSAAGASPELIPFTAAADAEFLEHGAARCISGVPSNPLGPPGPALITLAALQLANVPHLIVDAGSRILPDAPCIRLGDRPGGLISEGNAVPNAAVLFAAGEQLGHDLALQHDYLVIGESVPGGTTTALALLLALGIKAEGRVSSSMAENSHTLKTQIARQALAHLRAGRASALPAAAAIDPLTAVAMLGDPMQAAAAGLAAGALARGRPVLLAGGTQMVAVLALLSALHQAGTALSPDGNLAVATTRWVVDDPTSDAVGLMAEVGACPLLASTLSFAGSRHLQLRRYEDYLVKEGVGAGGAAVAAALAADVSPTALAERVEALYDALLESIQPPPLNWQRTLPDV